jgi:SAM-dependent methyltransferase
MSNSTLEKLYDSWSRKENYKVFHDIQCAREKADILADLLKINDIHLRNVVDIGCGYGAFLNRFLEIQHSVQGVGFDYSSDAVIFAKTHFGNDRLTFQALGSLEIEDIVQAIRQIGRQDCVFLIDILEHISNCRLFVKALSEVVDLFVIKLPLERSMFDNFILNKEYPSILHSNGHLREFDVDDVHVFIRSLGLVPIAETVMIYRGLKASFPPQINQSFKQRLVRFLIWLFKLVCSLILPKKLFLYFIGGGSYYAILRYQPEQASVEN